MSAKHRLTAIMFSDIVAYTHLMENDEATALTMLENNRQLHQKIISKYQGKLLKEMGDGIMSCFDSVSQAVQASLEIIDRCKKAENYQLRIGLHLGEVVFQNEDIFGDGVNIAARIQSLALPQSIVISQAVFNNIQNKEGYRSRFLGEKTLKNVAHPVKIYQLKTEDDDDSNKLITKNSLAVLPFVNMSNDPEQEYFCEGISEEIINTIVQVPEIKVDGRTSSFRFKGKNEDLRVVGNMLGVANILEGSVRKYGKRVRITAQLIEAATGFHLWSNKYDRELDDIFQIQDDISLEISKHLQKSIIGEKAVPKARQQTHKIKAYELYLKGRSLYYQRGKALWEALDCFTKALAIDPDYALASSGIADTYTMLSFHGYVHPKKCWSEAIPAARKALEQGPDLGETHNTLAIIALLHDRDLKATEQEFKKALKINPSHIQARCWYGLFYLITATSQFEQGIAELKEGIENDPLSSYATNCYGLGLSVTGQAKESIKWAKKAVELDPNSMLAYYTLGFSYQWAGAIPECIKEYQVGLKISDRHAWFLGLLLQAYLEAGKADMAEELYEEMQHRYKRYYFPPSILAQSAAVMGDPELAIGLSNEAYEIVDPYLSNIITIYPEAKSLRQLPGFAEIIGKFGYDLGSTN